MSSPEHKQLLSKYLNSGQKAARWLERSKSKCDTLGTDAAMTEDVFDAYENLTSRFARLSDVLLQKIFRLIDQVLLESPGSIVDIINRAEKRGICDAQKMRVFREVRNAIAHVYTEEELLVLFYAVQEKTDELLTYFKNTVLFIEDKKLIERI
jgi:uncharacterized protein YutE (UPF0331/DUF86 family)